MDAFVLKTAGVLDLSDDELLRLYETNSEIQIERDRHGNSGEEVLPGFTLSLGVLR